MENLSEQGRLQYLRVRCPHCFRMYSVNPKEIREASPKFSCVSCQTQFWLSFPECLQHPEIIGFPIKWLKPELDFTVESKDCPKCHAKVEMAAKECTSCGLVFEKFRPKAEDTGPQASTRLKDLWAAIVQEFDREELHQDFLRACQSESNISFALYRYNSMLEVQPSDRLAKRMRDSAKALLEVKVEMSTTRTAAARSPSRRSVRNPLKPLIMLITFVSMALLASGFFMPEFRNLIGFGAALLFLSMAVSYYGPRSI